MFDLVESSLLQNLSAATLPSDGAFGEANPLQDLTSQSTRRGFSQELPVQRLAEQLSLTNPLDNLSVTTGPDPIDAFTGLNVLDQVTSLDLLSDVELDAKELRDDGLLTGGLLDQASIDSAKGTFVVGKSGSVAIDFLFDGGDYAGELAVFTLAGMGGLSRSEFVQEAARRSLGNTSEGQVVIADRTEGAQFSGDLGERDRNQGTTASTKSLTLATGTRFALMLVPNSTIAAVAAGETRLFSSEVPLFSIGAYNPGGNAQIAQAAESIFAIEDMQIGQGDADFNDIILQIEGATTSVSSVAQLVKPNRNWLTNPTAEAFLSPPLTPEPPTEDPLPPIDPPTHPPSNPPVDPPIDPPIDPPVDPPIDPPTDPPITSAIVVDISGAVNKFTGSTSEEDIIATGADSVTFGSQTVYIGTEQVSSINQNPIVRSFDPINPDNNWTRRDLETTGTDGRGLGLIWTGTALYGVFSVDGTQGTAEEDFRRATQTAKQNWLRSYGAGGGGKVAVIGQIDPATGALLKAAYLSAVKQNGQSNSLSITGATVNNAGNLVLSAKSFFSPRRPNGSALTQNPGNTQGSPFDYTVEITPDLTEVVSTAADGWS